MNVYIYTAESGEIQRSVIGVKAEDVEKFVNTAEGEAVLAVENFVDLSTHFVQNGELVPFPPKPSLHHVWDWPTKSWLPNLDAARESQRQAWNAWRDRELVAGYPHNGHVFHSDDTFIGELQLLLKGYERGHITGTSAIRTRDNSMLQMTHAEIESLLLLIGLHRQAIYAQSWTGKDALAGLTTLEDIMAGGPPS